jgi:hypothetical protein
LIWPFSAIAARRNRKRGLFPYWDGQRTRWGDPFKIERLLCQGELDLQTVAPFVDQQKEPETTQFLELVCKAFDVTRWDDKTATGLTDEEVISLPLQFANYTDTAKKKSGNGQT